MTPQAIHFALGGSFETMPPTAQPRHPPAGLVECLTTQPCWQGGKPVPVGTAVLLSTADATYAQSIGRVRRVPDAQETESP